MDVVTLALARKFTEDTAIGLGAVKGKNCTVKGYELDEDGNTIVTFVWTRDDGIRVESPIKIKSGKDGLQITKIDIIDSHLVCTFSDGSIIESEEEFPAGGELKEKIVVSNPIGSATNGKVYDVGTPLEQILRDILIKEEAPTISLTITPTKTLYDKVVDTVSSVICKINASRKTYDISEVDVYVNDALVKSYTNDIALGGVFNYTHTWNPATNENFTIKVAVKDIKNMSATKSTTVKFVGKSYFGFVAPTVGEPTENEIKVLQNNTLKDSKSLVYNGVTFDYNKVVYAYPASFGELSSIKDVVNNINYTNSFTKTTVDVDGISYYVYTQNDPSQSVNNQLTFA